MIQAVASTAAACSFAKDASQSQGAQGAKGTATAPVIITGLSQVPQAIVDAITNFLTFNVVYMFESDTGVGQNDIAAAHNACRSQGKYSGITRMHAAGSYLPALTIPIVLDCDSARTWPN